MGLFFISVVLLLTALCGAYWFWRRHIEAELAEGAAIEWAHYQKHEPEFLEGITEKAFRQIYARVNMPRFPGYALAMFATFLLSLPVTFAILAAIVWAAQQMGLTPEPLEIIRAVNLGDSKAAEAWQCNMHCQLQVTEAYAGFYYFFGVLLAWLGIVAFFTRRYHGRRPGYLRDEIIRSRE
ncbi:MAG: hypothetical protein DHS20C05_12800 [Hyphococcus sp.]|nr:MAG: hypothetical protein DHS20C05_12800 [Marinicaulis sp.]